MAKWTFVLYGSDTDITSTEYPNLTDVQALSDIKSFSFPCTGPFAVPDIESDTYEYADASRTIETKVYARLKFNVKTARRFFSAINSNLESFWGLEAINKEYHWLFFDATCTERPASLTTTKALAVNIVAINASIEATGGRIMEMELSRRKVG